MDFVKQARDLLALDYGDMRVLEIGSYNVNGSVRELFPDVAEYIGIDIVEGPGVDQVMSSHDASDVWIEWFDVVLCCEMLEHDAAPWLTMDEVYNALKQGGHAIFTARGNGFKYHDPPDRWRFLPEGFQALFDYAGFEVRAIVEDWQVPGLFSIVRKPG